MDNRGNRTAAILGMVLVTFGVLMLVGQFLDDSPYIGAGLTLLMGLLFFAGAAAGGRNLSVMAIPGAVLVGIALLQLVQIFFPGLDDTPYLWTLIVSAVGLGMVLFGRLSGARELERGGWGVAKAGLVLFFVIGVIFEVVFSFAGLNAGPRSLLWPLALIAVGLVTLVVRLVRVTMAGGLFGAPQDAPQAAEIVATSDAEIPPSRQENRSRRLERRAARRAWRLDHDSYDLFSPVLWIGFGILWLQLVLNMLSFDRLFSLINLWPVLLIVAGINVIFGQRRALVNLGLGLLLVVGAFFAANNADQLGLTGRWPWMGANFVVNGRAIERVSPSGNVISETRPVSAFSGVVLTGGGDVTLIQGSPASLVIEADDNLLPYLTSEVRSGALFLGVQEGIGFSPTRLRYTITAPDLNRLEVNGAASVRAEQLHTASFDLEISGFGAINLPDLQVDTFNAQLSGSGSVSAAGRADQLNVQISGAGSFNGPDLRSQQANVQISGVGRAGVWATDSLMSSISGLGTVGYYGDPDVRKTTGGLGVTRALGNK